MIPDALLGFAESAINRALDTDALAASELSTLRDKVFAIECLSPALPISLYTDSEGIGLSNGIREDASVVLSGSLPSLMTLAAGLARNESDFSSSGVEIRGDVGALLQLSRVLSRLDIDWEEILSSFIGEIPARLFFLGLERIQKIAPDFKEKSKEVSANFITGPGGIAKAEEATEVRVRLRQLQYRLDRIEAAISKQQQYEVEK